MNDEEWAAKVEREVNAMIDADPPPDADKVLADVRRRAAEGKRRT